MLDIAIIGLYFVLITTFGLWMGRKEESLDEFALGGRAIPWWAVLVSIIAAETSAATFLGTPGEAFATRSFLYIQMGLGLILGRAIAAFLFIRPYYELRVYSIYEFMEKRFGPKSNQAASALFLLTRTLAMGARLYVAAIVLAVFLKMTWGRPLTSSEELITYLLCVLAMILLTTLYTALGGIKAVIWTDLIQTSVMIGGGLTALVILYFRIPNGLDGIERVLGPLHAIPIVDWSMDFTRPYTFWSALFGMTFLTMATHGTDQDMVQRMLTAKHYRLAQLSALLSGLADLPILFLFLSIGLLLSVFYTVFPDAGLPQKTNEIFAYFILKELPPGMKGLVIAGIFATAMGSLSTALNALATSFTQDWCRRPTSTEKQLVSTARRSTALFGLLMLLIAGSTATFVIFYPQSRMIPLVLGIIGYTYGSLLGVFLLGALTKTRGSDSGNLIAMSVGILVVVTISILPNTVAFPWRILIGTIATFSIGSLFRSQIPS